MKMSEHIFPKYNGPNLYITKLTDSQRAITMQDMIKKIFYHNKKMDRILSLQNSVKD